MTTYFLRHPACSIISQQSQIIAVTGRRELITIRDDVDVSARLLWLLREARTLDDLRAAAGATPDRVEALVSRLVALGLVRSGGPELAHPALAPSRPASEKPCARCVMGISGTIQAATVLPVACMLKALFAQELELILTRSATRFLPPHVPSYFGFRVWTDAFKPRGDINVPHIWLGSTATLVLVLPASARTICRLATGACSDLLSLTVAASTAPIVVAPAMNAAMLATPAVRRNLERLRDDGVFVIEPGLGREVSQTSDGSLAFSCIGSDGRDLVTLLTAILRRADPRVAAPIDAAGDRRAAG
jgi:hypothetical protein